MMISTSPDARTRQGILFQPFQLGRYELPHRMLMVPLTRSRARQRGNVPTPLMVTYCAQRTSAALIISEATQVSMQGQGYAWTPGIGSRDQIEGWRLVTEAVHQCGGAFSFSYGTSAEFQSRASARWHVAGSALGNPTRG